MSYIALYRRWRPKTFTDVVGQQHISETLMRAIREDRVAHAYLFSGPRGTGKTSMAKIFARALNCEQGPTDHPCNTCLSCQQNLAGQAMDVLEIDAASNRGIDEVRALRESINYLPVEGRKKVFIIDEAHMLTTEAWNALLKTIEEPPAHVLFIFATTEVEKLPITILSRCQRYTFRRITAEDISAHLLRVSEASDIKLDKGAAQLIAVHADGGLRDALSLLDQCAGMTGETITVGLVETLTGLVSKVWMIDLLNALEEGDGAFVLLAIKQALLEGRDGTQIISSLAIHVRALLLGQILPDSEELSVYESCKEKFILQCQAIDSERLQFYTQGLQRIQQDVKKVENPRIIIEMGLLSLVARRVESTELLSRVALLEQKQDSKNNAVLNRLAKLEGQIASGDIGATSRGETIDHVEATVPTPPMAKPMGIKSTLPPPLSPRKPLPKVSLPPVEKKQPANISRQVVSGGVGIISPASYKDIHDKAMNWLMKKQFNMARGYYALGAISYVDQHVVVIAFQTSFNVKMAKGDAVLREASEAFSQALGRPIQIEVVIRNSPEYRAYVEQARAGKVDKAESIDKEHTPSNKSMAAKNAALEALKSLQNKGSVESVVDDFGDVATPNDEYEFLSEDEHNAFEEEAFYEKVKQLPKWDINNMSEDEKNDPILANALEHLSQEHDIYVEVINEEE